jgi:RNA polymerase subunit RPABC4/transcription elongation factor Spt4
MNPENDIDSFVLHAEFALEFRCKICGKRLPADDISPEQFTDNWFKLLGAKAAREGWTVLNEWEAICPECSKGQFDMGRTPSG